MGIGLGRAEGVSDVSDEKERWYCVTTGGLAKLCADGRDAVVQAMAFDNAYPRQGPHRAVRLVDAAEVEALRAEVKAHKAKGVALLPIGPHDHPEPNSHYWSSLELSAIRQYAAACVEADRIARARNDTEPKP